MHECGVAPNTYTYNAYINAHAKAPNPRTDEFQALSVSSLRLFQVGEMTAAAELLNQMETLPACPPSPATYTSLVDACAHADAADNEAMARAFGLLDRMEAR